MAVVVQGDDFLPEPMRKTLQTAKEPLLDLALPHIRPALRVRPSPSVGSEFFLRWMRTWNEGFWITKDGRTVTDEGFCRHARSCPNGRQLYVIRLPARGMRQSLIRLLDLLKFHGPLTPHPVRMARLG